MQVELLLVWYYDGIEALSADFRQKEHDLYKLSRL
jgi:hypothetical protein